MSAAGNGVESLGIARHRCGEFGCRHGHGGQPAGSGWVCPGRSSGRSRRREAGRGPVDLAVRCSDSCDRAPAFRYRGQELTGLSESRLRPLRRKLQMVFQDPHASLNPSMTIGRAISDVLRIHGLHKNDRPGSGGCGSRASRARSGRPVHPEVSVRSCPAARSSEPSSPGAIALGPELLVADELISMLDMSVRAKILGLLDELRRDLGLTFVYITHDLASARFFANRIAIMYLGKIVETVLTAEIFDHPRHPYTQALLRAIPDPTHHVASRATFLGARFRMRYARRPAARSTLGARPCSRTAAGRLVTRHGFRAALDFGHPGGVRVGSHAWSAMSISRLHVERSDRAAEVRPAPGPHKSCSSSWRSPRGQSGMNRSGRACGRCGAERRRGGHHVCPPRRPAVATRRRHAGKGQLPPAPPHWRVVAGTQNSPRIFSSDSRQC